MQSTKGHPSIFAGQFQTESVWIWENSAECAFKTCYYWGSHVLTSLLEVSGTLVAWSMSLDFRSTLGVPILPALVSCQLNWTKMTKPVKEWLCDYKYLLLAAVIHYIPSDSWSRTIWHVHNMKVQLGRNWYVLPVLQTIFRSEDALNIE